MALLFPEHRRALATGRVALTPEDFFTDFGKRVFTRVMEMENSADGFHFSALGEYFSPDEVGRLVKLQQDRQSLANNDESVLAAAAEALRDKREKRQALSSGDWQSEIARRRAAFKKKQDNE